MVQTVKKLLQKADDPYLALLAYRDTPGHAGKSPAEISMGRRLRTRVPVYGNLLQPRHQAFAKFRQEDKRVRQKQRQHYNRRHAVKELRLLEPGEKVWVKDLKKSATVEQYAGTPRSYLVRTVRGCFRRNRRYLVPLGSTASDSTRTLLHLPVLPCTSPVDNAGERRTPGLETPRVERPTPVSQGDRTPVAVTRYGRRVYQPVRLGIEK
ncbi:uncharacterized protein LOC135391522 [Ornithodoros turicata]|uniref:uncharacterized protein LOC135391522 n=1 Tax=Ornithodoros turicata TaxID=34597 RepID=UPI0031397BFC